MRHRLRQLIPGRRVGALAAAYDQPDPPGDAFCGT